MRTRWLAALDAALPQKDWAALLLCAVAALSSTYLSGLSFPEQNNLWHIPVVLDFAGSAEGPHDLYNRSFVNFVSAFWLPFRLIATDRNVESLFVMLQLLGNMLLGLTIYAYLRGVTGNIRASALVSSAFCFCYGLWGLTRLGYSEIFVTYATHTQFGILLCLAALLLLVLQRTIGSAIVLALGLAVNAFMALWTAAACGLFLLARERRVLTRTQWTFFGLFGLLSLPMLIWMARSGSSSGKIPLEYFDTYLGGHVYALDYPQAALQMFALGLSAGLAVFQEGEGHAPTRHLGIAMLCCMLVLAIGAAMPYVNPPPLFLLLHPLRFASIVEILSAICAGVLLVRHVAGSSAPLPILAAFAAAAGFMLKVPLVSILGFCCLLSLSSPAFRRAGLALSLLSVASLLFPDRSAEISLKGALAFDLVAVTLGAVLLRFDSLSRQDALLLSTVAVLGAASAVPAGPAVLVAVLCALPAMLIVQWPAAPRWTAGALLLNMVALVWLLLGLRHDPSRLVLIAPGVMVLAGAALLSRQTWLQNFPYRKYAVVMPLAALIVAGFGKGAGAHYWVSRTPEQRDFLAAENWARANTPQGSVFLPVEQEDAGFALFSRRPVWWDRSMGAAVMWYPAFHDVWACRRDAVRAARKAGRMGDLARDANIDFVIARSRHADFTGFETAFENGRFTILRRVLPRTDMPVCAEPHI